MSRSNRLDNSKRIMLKYIVCFIITAFAACGANAEVAIKSIAMDSSSIPFILDDKGDVWAFKAPMMLDEAVKLPNLHHIKKIVPFMALAEDGQVYTWELTKESKWEDELNLDAGYTEPKLVKGLSHVTDIDASGNYFVAVEDNQRVYEWGEKFTNFLNGAKQVIPDPKLIYTHAGIKSVSTLGYRIVVLLEDNTIAGWGNNQQGQMGGDGRANILPEQFASFTLPEPIAAVFTAGYTIALTKSGRAFFWGDCTRVDNQKADTTKADSGTMTDIAAIATSKAGDELFPDLYLKKDGSVWLEYAPIPKNIKQCQYFSRVYNYNSPTYSPKGMTVPAIAIANGGGGVSLYNAIALGTDNTLWGISTRHPNEGFKKIAINLTVSEGK